VLGIGLVLAISDWFLLRAASRGYVPEKPL
jgi:hypothetical protein